MIIALFAGLVVVVSGTIAQAAMVDTNVFYISDTLTTDSNNANNATLFDLSFSLALTKDNNIFLGWEIVSAAFTATTTVTAKHASTDMGLKFSYFFGRSQVWGLGLGYLLLSNGTYDDGSGTSAKWRGTAIKADFGYAPEVATNTHLGFRLNYYAPTVNESVVGDTTLSKVAYKRATIYPSIYFLYLY